MLDYFAAAATDAKARSTWKHRIDCHKAVDIACMPSRNASAPAKGVRRSFDHIDRTGAITGAKVIMDVSMVASQVCRKDSVREKFLHSSSEIARDEKRRLSGVARGLKSKPNLSTVLELTRACIGKQIQRTLVVE